MNDRLIVIFNNKTLNVDSTVAERLNLRQSQIVSNEQMLDIARMYYSIMIVNYHLGRAFELPFDDQQWHEDMDRIDSLNDRVDQMLAQYESTQTHRRLNSRLRK